MGLAQIPMAIEAELVGDFGQPLLALMLLVTGGTVRIVRGRLDFVVVVAALHMTLTAVFLTDGARLSYVEAKWDEPLPGTASDRRRAPAAAGYSR